MKRPMKLVSHIGILGVIGVASYFLGKLSKSEPPKEQKRVPSSSVLTSRPSKSAFHQAVRLFASKPTSDRALDLRQAILELPAGSLKSLWNAHQDTFDYHDGEDMELAIAILSRLATLDPQAAMECVPGSGAAKYKLLPAVLIGWVKQDREAALHWIRSCSDPRARHECMTAVIEHVGKTDHEAAFELFVSAVRNKTIPKRSWVSSGFFGKWVREDPQQALAKALAYQRMTSSEEAVTGAMGAWSRIDPSAAAQWIANMAPPDIQTSAYETLIEGWAEVSPREAAAFMETLRGLKDYSKLLEKVLEKWRLTNPESLEEWTNGLTNSTLQSEVLQLNQAIASSQELKANRELGLDYLKQLDHPENRDSFLKESGRLAGKDPLAAFAWGEQHLQESAFRDDFTASVLDAMSRRVPEEAAKHLQKLPHDHPHRKRVHNRTAAHWSNKDPRAARQWFDQLAPGDERDAALLGLAEGWLENHRINAEAWLETVLPDSGPLHDQLLDLQAMAAARETDSDEAARAIAFASRMENPHKRDQTFERLVRKWAEAETRVDAALQFTRETDLISESVRWRILESQNAVH